MLYSSVRIARNPACEEGGDGESFPCARWTLDQRQWKLVALSNRLSLEPVEATP